MAGRIDRGSARRRIGMRRDDRTFGQRLRQARLLAGLSQTQLEERSGIPKARLSRYENGHVLPSLGTLQKLASSLGVSEATLLGDQRAILEGFFTVLSSRGVKVYTEEQGAKLAHALADLLGALDHRNEGDSEPMAEVQSPEAPAPALVWDISG
jgi:transcriptional regulator with XRE-family HTH domain